LNHQLDKICHKEIKVSKKEKASKESSEADDFASDLIQSLNKEFSSRIAFNLATDESPTHIKRWISSGCRILDYIASNRREGGFPEGRIIEIAGPPSIGKSHIAFSVAKIVQAMGGLVVYIDTENAVPIEKLGEMGIDISKRFVYCDTHCTEEVFSIIESTITKARQMAATKDTPILIVWDSVAATSPKQELEGEYDKDTMGLQARVIAKGLRKITGVIGQTNTTLICLNQIKTKIGVVYGDPTYTPGGQGIPFHASIRIRLAGG
jgi:recombination protein RecA